MSDLIIRGLTLWRPWSYAILRLGKRVENRDWSPPGYLRDGWIAIHGGKKWDAEAAADIEDELDIRLPYESRQEGIVGVARLVGVATTIGELPEGQERWFVGDFGWILDDVRPLPKAVLRPGAQGLWLLTDEELAVVRPIVEGAAP